MRTATLQNKTVEKKILYSNNKKYKIYVVEKFPYLV